MRWRCKRRPPAPPWGPIACRLSTRATAFAGARSLLLAYRCTVLTSAPAHVVFYRVKRTAHMVANAPVTGPANAAPSSMQQFVGRSTSLGSASGELTSGSTCGSSREMGASVDTGLAAAAHAASCCARRCAMTMLCSRLSAGHVPAAGLAVGLATAKATGASGVSAAAAEQPEVSAAAAGVADLHCECCRRGSRLSRLPTEAGTAAAAAACAAGMVAGGVDSRESQEASSTGLAAAAAARLASVGLCCDCCRGGAGARGWPGTNAGCTPGTAALAPAAPLTGLPSAAPSACCSLGATLRRRRLAGGGAVLSGAASGCWDGAVVGDLSAALRAACAAGLRLAPPEVAGDGVRRASPAHALITGVVLIRHDTQADILHCL